jgi:DNA polymerase
MNYINKDEQLKKLAEEIENCTECKIDKTGMMVFGEGNPDAKVMFVGEAPGKNEAKTGRPFIGRSGQLLRSLIRSIGLKEEDVYITSPVKYLPNRGTPTKDDIAHARTHFSQQLSIINPEIIVLLGSVAAQGVLQEVIPVTKMHGTVVEKNGKKYFITVHPAAGLRFPPLKKTFEEDFEKLRELLMEEKIIKNK